MKIDEYFLLTGTTQTFLAKKAGISRVTLSNILIKKILPNLKTARAIEKATDGQVTLYDWLDESDVKESHEIHNDKKKHPKKTPFKN